MKQMKLTIFRLYNSVERFEYSNDLLLLYSINVT